MKIRDAIKEAMQYRKIKSKDLAEHIGIAKTNMSLFLNGKMNLNQDRLEALLEYLGIELVIRK